MKIRGNSAGVHISGNFMSTTNCRGCIRMVYKSEIAQVCRLSYFSRCVLKIHGTTFYSEYISTQQNAQHFFVGAI